MDTERAPEGGWTELSCAALDEEGRTTTVAALIDGADGLPITIDGCRLMRFGKGWLKIGGQNGDTEGSTGLLTASTFRLAIASALEAGESGTLLVITTAELRQVTQLHGRALTDDVMVKLGRRLRKLADSLDAPVIGRLADGEFGWLLPTGLDEISAANRIHRTMIKPIEAAGVEVPLTVSVGAVRFGDERLAAGGTAADSTPGIDPVIPSETPLDAGELLRRADVAAERARHTREHRELWIPELDESAGRLMRVVAALDGITRRDELEIMFQPQVDLPTGEYVGLEALLRWNHPQLGPVSPAEFIEVAEASGRIRALTRWVLPTAVGRLAELRRAGHTDIHLSINFTPADLLDRDLAVFVETCLLVESVPADRLTVEITESSLGLAFNDAIPAIRALRRLGCRISIDDFGTGHSSVARLKELGPDELKIDRDFVKAFQDPDEDYVLAGWLVRLGRALNMTVVAEGVETREDAMILTTLGCNVAQGYLISRPVAFDEIQRLIAAGPMSLPVPDAVDRLNVSRTTGSTLQPADGAVST